MGRIRAIITDLDGTCADTQGIHAEVESKLLARYGVMIYPDEITADYAGMRTEDLFIELLPNTGVQYDLNHIMEEKWKLMRLYNNDIKPMPGAKEFILKAAANGFLLGLASSSRMRYVQRVLHTLEINKYFLSIVSGDRVERNKPDPESLLLAAKELQTDPQYCVMIGDSHNDIIAAKRAGMKSIHVSPTNGCAPDLWVKSLSEISVDLLEQL
jgi:HAD superfamily hydrolase (TIGR01509 family)